MDFASTDTHGIRSCSTPRKQPILTISDGINFILNKIPFPPSFKSFNGVKIIFIITFLHRIHFYSVYAFIANLSATRLSDNDIDDANEDSSETAHAYFAFVFMLGTYATPHNIGVIQIPVEYAFSTRLYATRLFNCARKVC